MSRKSILNFKAGKMTTSLQSNGKYLVEPDKRRGELHVVYVSGVSGNGVGGRVKLEWKDRRTKVRFCWCFVCFYLCVNVCNIVCVYHVRNLHKPALNLYLYIYIYKQHLRIQTNQ